MAIGLKPGDRVTCRTVKTRIGTVLRLFGRGLNRQCVVHWDGRPADNETTYVRALNFHSRTPKRPS